MIVIRGEDALRGIPGSGPIDAGLFAGFRDRHDVGGVVGIDEEDHVIALGGDQRIDVVDLLVIVAFAGERLHDSSAFRQGGCKQLGAGNVLHVVLGSGGAHRHGDGQGFVGQRDAEDQHQCKSQSQEFLHNGIPPFFYFVYPCLMHGKTLYDTGSFF